MKISIPYYKGFQQAEIEDRRINAVVVPQEPAHCSKDEKDIVREALEHPVQSQRLCELARGAEKILFITSDHTRPMPSHITAPLILEELRRQNPRAKIKVLIATGFHRPMTRQEMEARFGRHLTEREEFVMHDSCSPEMVFKGILPSGGELWLNPLIDWADLVVSEGFIEPHLFAGYSGGRKSILPGIASQTTVYANHCSRLVGDAHSRAGNLNGNPIQKDMLFAARKAGLRFILNVSLNREKKIEAAFAGDLEAAHAVGCEFVGRNAKAEAAAGDIVITSNGGYPLDMNIYQSVKCMSTAEGFVKEGGVIIACCSCVEGHGSAGFFDMLDNKKSPEALWDEIMSIPQEKTKPDQWQAQILARILKKARVILVSDMCDHEIIQRTKIIPARTLEDALEYANANLPNGRYTVIPNGIAVFPQAEGR